MSERSAEMMPEAKEHGLELTKDQTRVSLRFFRHNDKEKDPSKTDQAILLTEKGLKDAKSRAEDADITFSIAAATDRARTQQTAMAHMAGGLPELAEVESVDEMENVIDGIKTEGDARRQAGSKLFIDQRLNFVLDKRTPFGEEAYERAAKGVYLKFMIEESDALARELGDTTSSTYESQARNVAEIVEKYVQTEKNFDKLYRSKDETERKTNELKRFFGSHQGVLESFLAKLVEKTKGMEERGRFVKALNNSGFDFSEGFEMDITTETSGEEPKVHLRYEKPENSGQEAFVFDEDIPLELLSEIAAEKRG